jgi:hypothetical protein
MTVRCLGLVTMTKTNNIPKIKRWNSNPDRETLRVIHRFLSCREAIERVSLEPSRTHPRLVRATLSDRILSTEEGILEIRWYETGDFDITYQTDRGMGASPLLRWIHLPDTEEIKVSHSRSDNVRTLTPPSHYLRENRFHPLRLMPLVLATVREYTK